MRRFIVRSFLSSLVLASAAGYADAKNPSPDLSGELKSLENGGFTPTNQEKLYVVQDRHVDLTNSVEFILGAGKDFNSNIYLKTEEVSLAARYHFNNFFFAQVDGARVNSSLTESGDRIWRNDGIYPNASFVKNRYGAALGLNLMYGKVRVTKNFVFYFDQFFTLGAGRIEQTNGLETSKDPTITGEAGIAFSLGDWASLIVGARDTYFEEKRRTSAGKIHQVVAYSGVGVLIGGKAL